MLDTMASFPMIDHSCFLLPQAALARVIAFLSKQQKRFGIKVDTGNINGMLSKKPLQMSELQSLASAVVAKSLQAQGWQHLTGGIWIKSKYLEVPAGCQQKIMQMELGGIMVSEQPRSSINLQIQDAGGGLGVTMRLNMLT